ncbi:MAG: DUF4129 domain-containing protein [Verrucomicrobiaceae bacterium]|nr:DUF4129 domain-containing protein [Verrucomicrobiaceae bacterium]
MSRRTTRRHRETGSIQILEEAFHLLCRAGVSCYWSYYLGAVPFALGTLYFVADMSRSGFAQRDAAFVAVVMTALYFWMRYCQAKFCARLWWTLNPEAAAAPPRRGRFAGLAALFLLQAFSLPVLVIAAFFAIPLGWAVAMQQNFSVLALTRDTGGRPLRELLLQSLRFAHHEWAQNHGILLIFFFVSLFTWVNIVASCVLLSGFGKSLFGMENIFTLNPIAAMMNTTFLLGSFLLMQLGIVPMLLATYTLRCFYADSRGTGADLLSRLATCRDQREAAREGERGATGGGTRTSVARVGLLVFAAVSFVALAGEPVAAAEDESAVGESAVVPESALSGRSERFRGEITETLEQKKYQWQLSRRALAVEGEETERSWIALRIEEIAASAKQLVDTAGKWFDDMMRRLLDKDRVGRGGGREPDFRFFKELSSGFSLALVVLLLGLLVWLALVLYRKHRSRVSTEIVEEGESARIDLASEDIVATQLHEEEWMRLAREQIRKGDERLAVRALFLATLAHLGDRGLLKIARFKSNRDYRGELAMRARTRSALRDAFDENTTLFERVWYGMHRLGEGSIDFYLKNHETISRESADATDATGTTRPAMEGRR